MAFLRVYYFSSVLMQHTTLTAAWSESAKKPMPVLYLLHGGTDDSTLWFRESDVESLCERYGLLAVSLDARSSSYADMRHGQKFFTYLTQELPEFLAHRLPVSSRREDTFIAGFSMGGQGATQLGFTYPDRFARIGAFSYPLINYHQHPDGRVFGDGYPEYDARFWRQVANQGGMEAFMKSPYNTWDTFFNCEDPESLPKIHFYIGMEDFFWPVHCEMKEELKKRGREDVPITEYEGLHHEWEVWDRAVKAFIDECDGETMGAGFRY